MPSVGETLRATKVYPRVCQALANNLEPQALLEERQSLQATFNNIFDWFEVYAKVIL
jgi:hypothetical protein